MDTASTVHEVEVAVSSLYEDKNSESKGGYLPEAEGGCLSWSNPEYLRASEPASSMSAFNGECVKSECNEREGDSEIETPSDPPLQQE